MSVLVLQAITIVKVKIGFCYIFYILPAIKSATGGYYLFKCRMQRDARERIPAVGTIQPVDVVKGGALSLVVMAMPFTTVHLKTVHVRRKRELSLS